MNIPAKIARAQGHHGIKGASHGIKGGRPKLDLTDAERAERRRKQREDYRRRKGIAARKPGTPRWEREYVAVWGKPPGEPLTSEEFAEREPLWNARVKPQTRTTPKKRRTPGTGKPQNVGAQVKPALAYAQGRNEPCACGSGRKFKKCCGR